MHHGGNIGSSACSCCGTEVACVELVLLDKRGQFNNRCDNTFIQTLSRAQEAEGHCGADDVDVKVCPGLSGP